MIFTVKRVLWVCCSFKLTLVKHLVIVILERRAYGNEYPVITQVSDVAELIRGKKVF